MSYEEAVQWAKYRRERGSLNLALRIERAVAQLSFMYACVNMKNPPKSIYEFLPYEKQPEVKERELTFEEMAMMFCGKR